MLTQVLLLLSGLGILTLGAEGLVRGSGSLALRLGLTPLVIGLTVVAFGTSFPELVVSLGATFNDQPDVALGNVVGSNIFNIGIILGLSALICPIRISVSVIKVDVPVMITLSLLAVWLVLEGFMNAYAGGVFLAVLAAYAAFNVQLAKKQNSGAKLDQPAPGVPARSGSLGIDLAFIGAGLILLVVGARLLVGSATDMARLLGVSEAVISLTVVAAGTSLPELATSFIAAIRRQPDIAVGNVVGSNIFNILGILGASSLVEPITAPGIGKLDLGVMIAFSIVLLPLIWTGRHLSRPEGLALIMGYAAYLWLLWP